MIDLSTIEARKALAGKYAAKYGLDPVLVCAVCEQESAWNPWAYRYEPGFFAKYVSPLGLKDGTEAIMRSTSWGLMQVMGQVAREHGYKATFLSSLCDPDTGVDVGCDVLKSKLALGGGDVRAGLLRWNGGGSQSYPDQVMARMEKYQ